MNNTTTTTNTPNTPNADDIYGNNSQLLVLYYLFCALFVIGILLSLISVYLKQRARWAIHNNIQSIHNP